MWNILPIINYNLNLSTIKYKLINFLWNLILILTMHALFLLFAPVVIVISPSSPPPPPPLITCTTAQKDMFIAQIVIIHSHFLIGIWHIPVN